ncbi:MAG: hypothetical protein HOP02_16575 [Methylococcaceae bacterium]|nr:hypothetical protein [Methylococcaceae bacterium]
MAEQLYIKSAALCCPEPELLAGFDLACLSVDNNLIPAAMRRRTSLTTRIAITAATSACKQAGVDTALLPSVFASLGGEIQVTDAICRVLPIPDELLSPTQFHNSVHNTTAGYWGILNQCQAASTAIAAVDDTFAMGLLEAYTQLQLTGGDLLLVCYDEQWPQYLAPPIGQFACACALVLSTDWQQALGSISVPHIKPIDSPLDEHWSALVNAVPAAAAVPLLCAINTQQPAVIPLNTKGNIWFTHFERF